MLQKSTVVRVCMRAGPQSSSEVIQDVFPLARDGVRSEGDREVQLRGAMVCENLGHVVVLQLPLVTRKQLRACEVGPIGTRPRDPESRALSAKGQVEGARSLLAKAVHDVVHGAILSTLRVGTALIAGGRLVGPVLPDIEFHSVPLSVVSFCPSHTGWAAATTHMHEAL